MLLRSEARRIAQRLLKPLAAAGRASGVKVLVGTRRGAGGELLSALGAEKRLIDLDTPEYLERDDLVEYVRRWLLRDGEPGARTPYRAQPAVASRVAQAVADRASPSFLIAQLASRALAGADELVDTTRSGWETQFPADGRLPRPLRAGVWTGRRSASPGPGMASIDST